MRSKWECKIVQPLWKMAQKFFKIPNTELLYDPAIPLPGICSEDMKGICTPILTAVLLTIGKRWKRPKSPSKVDEKAKCGRWDISFPIKNKANWHLHKMDEP